MNQLVRDEVFRRAAGRCEACGESFAGGVATGQLDHFFGRAKAEEVAQNCWALCLRCHDNKTNNRPKAMHWNISFIRNCSRFFGAGDNRYLAPMDRAFTRIATLGAKGFD